MSMSTKSASTNSISTVQLSETVDGVRRLVLDRPDALNTVNVTLIAELTAALDEIDADPSCHAVLLTGAGRAFCAGLDLKGYGDDDLVDEQGVTRRYFSRQSEIANVVQRMLRLRQPIIAAVNGPAAGAGLALVLASDIRIAASGAIFAVSFIRAGYSACDIGTSWLLPRLVGAARAHELMLTGRRFDAEEALRIGLLIDVVAPESLLEVAQAKAAEIALNPPFSVELTKQGMWIALETSVQFENRQQIVSALTEDQPEAAQAFLEKRPPAYRYR
jgi:enoyl-CoA hydratase/carnithine racemase